jgi:uncharacterized protein Yka (UPF0111/DUF47 family)
MAVMPGSAGSARRTSSLGRWGARLARDLTGRSSEQLLVLLRAQLDITVRGARLVERLAGSEIGVEEAHDAMRDLEHAGDSARRRLVTELGRVLVTPVDAEDLFRISRSVDDVLDNLRDFVREVALYVPDRLDFALDLARAIVDGSERLGPALDRLAAGRSGSREETLATKKAAGMIRRLYQQQLAELFNSELDAETLKRRELLRRLDVVGLRLGEAADALADGVLKRNR